MTERICAVVNPRAGAGAGGRLIPALRAEAARRGIELDLLTTGSRGQGTDLARDAVDRGHDLVLAVGGDGTISEVAAGLVGEGRLRREGVALTVLSAGTGGDLARTIGRTTAAAEAFDLALDPGRGRRVDVALVDLVGEGGAACRRVCVNVLGFGANGEVVRRVNASSKRLGGTITFLDATLRTVATFRAPQARLSWVAADGTAGEWEGRLMSCFLANGQYCGSGMWMGRGGSMTDGALELTIIPERGILWSMAHTWRLFDGTARDLPGVVGGSVVSLRGEAVGDVEIHADVDGEQPGILPIQVRVVPRLLEVRAKWTGEPAAVPAG